MRNDGVATRKILVCTWGRPWYNWNLAEEHFSWKPIKYVLESDSTANDRSSLPILVNNIKPDEVYIIVLDTVITLNGESINLYDDIVTKVKEKYAEFIRAELPSLDASKITIWVLPGVGEFPNCVIEGRMLDFYSAFMFEMVKTIVFPDVQCYEFNLDLTHGINFMPTLVYRAMKEIGCILALFADVTFKVFNSDPYDPTANHLNVNKLEETQLQPAPCGEMLTLERPRCLRFDSKCRAAAAQAFDRNHRITDVQRLNPFLG